MVYVIQVLLTAASRIRTGPHLFCFIIRIYDDARSPERQIRRKPLYRLSYPGPHTTTVCLSYLDVSYREKEYRIGTNYSNSSTKFNLLEKQMTLVSTIKLTVSIITGSSQDYLNKKKMAKE